MVRTYEEGLIEGRIQAVERIVEERGQTCGTIMEGLRADLTGLGESIRSSCEADSVPAARRVSRRFRGDRSCRNKARETRRMSRAPTGAKNSRSELRPHAGAQASSSPLDAGLPDQIDSAQSRRRSDDTPRPRSGSERSALR